MLCPTLHSISSVDMALKACKWSLTMATSCKWLTWRQMRMARLELLKAPRAHSYWSTMPILTVHRTWKDTIKTRTTWSSNCTIKDGTSTSLICAEPSHQESMWLSMLMEKVILVQPRIGTLTSRRKPSLTCQPWSMQSNWSVLKKDKTVLKCTSSTVQTLLYWLLLSSQRQRKSKLLR